MAFKLKIKNKNANPVANNLDIAELGYNSSSKVLFVGNGAAAPTEIVDTASAQTISGAKTFTSIISATQISLDGLSTQDTATVTTTSTAQTALASFAVATFGSGKFLIQATRGSIRQMSELLVVHNGTTAEATEYAIVQTGTKLFTTEVDISGGNVRVLVTSTATTSTVYRTSFTLIGV